MAKANSFKSHKKIVAGKKAKAGVTDARNKIIAKKRKSLTDARDRLAKLAKKTDARKKLEKLRDARKPTVKKTAGGAITITKNNKGGLLLTTKKKLASSPKDKLSRVSKAGTYVTKKVGRGGSISLSTKSRHSGTVLKKPSVDVERRSPRSASRDRKRSRSRTKTVRGSMSAAGRLDEELINTYVDPVILKRTVRQDVRERSPLRSRHYRRSRSRSPRDYYDRPSRRRELSPYKSRYDSLYDDNRENYGRRPNYDYDDPRREMEREDEMYRRRLREEEMSLRRKQYDDISHSTGSYVSPLQGVKVVVSNLQPSVTNEDISELFGDIGTLKRSTISGPGQAEVVFVSREDALKAVEVYNNRQLDGNPMRCQIVGANALPHSQLIGFKLPQGVSSKSSSRPTDSPDISSIHKALFAEKRHSQGVLPMASSGGRSNFTRKTPQFTITVPPNQRRY